MRTLSSVPIPYQESPEGARHADLMADDGSNDPDFTSSVYHHTRIIGPIAPFDADFYELCIAKGLATMDDRDCAANDKLWARFYRLSSDPTLPLYKFHFINGVTSADFKSNVPPEAIAQLEFWTDNYGDVLLQNFIAKISPRLRLWSMAEIRATTKDSLLRRSTSQTCAIYAMAATCVDSWSIKKRAYLALSFHRCAMTYLQRALNPPSLDAIRTLVLLAAFPLQSDSSLLNSWALALAFEMKLNIDPEHWQIPEEEKTLRRRLFWLIIVSHRWSASKHLYPNVSNDCYDTLVPTTEETSDQTFSIEVQVSDIVASITQSFYSVRGAKMVHHNHEASMVVAKHLESQVIEVQNTLRHASSSSDMFASFSLTMLHLNLGFATLMIHRPFLDSKSLGVMDALEYHQKAAQAALGCISTLQRMPDAYFTEAWPTHSIVMLATITFTLLRESILSKDDNLRIQCREGLMNFMAVTYHQASRWSLSRFGSLFISVANALSGEEYGDWTTTPGPVAHEYEISPLMRNSENAPTDNIDFATFEWEHFGQLLGLDSSSLIGDWMQA
ncbi:protein of unknown function [Taphrina deformans PYCC 5710]|uniref:Xylanolytic transcriptional activator regulatory domain-containing protein n=1 Tax=Taphrina deformans (strain PYCC 5710 / ATCC 11124 / CBS 356.35 / IMI 108563 / JCM 9778 / NBRC 8474) TaxID=1097556 RepID=R4XIN8_TAPDE|nr:protein of unknown function [Taphrina deformans PYCC 5710]|eukprot:CCG84369.1 protein of unknown function [Taphrina deformans PYCC 5710]